MFGGVRMYFVWGDVSKVKQRKWYCVSFPHKCDSSVESPFKFFLKLRTMQGSGRATGKTAKNGKRPARKYAVSVKKLFFLKLQIFRPPANIRAAAVFSPPANIKAAANIRPPADIRPPAQKKFFQQRKRFFLEKKNSF